MTEDLKTHLAQQIQRVDWKPLDPHARRAGLLVVDPALNLAEVGVAHVARAASSILRSCRSSGASVSIASMSFSPEPSPKTPKRSRRS